MCDENSAEFKDSEIVWVKLGARWWPGEVKDINSLPAEITGALKKPPLVVVKFFDEDSYEFVRNKSNIHPYNCDKKNDFIKRGMDAFRAKQSHMEKFPKDVSTAEMKTDGNPNILSDPLFAPEKKTNYSALFFGNSPTAKKTTKESTPRKKQSHSKNQSSKPDMSHITHRRFLGNDDYVAHIRIQYPGRDRNSDDEIAEPPQEKKEYTCNTCRFITDCLEVIILHNAAHSRLPSDPVGSFTTSKKEKKPLLKKEKSKQPKKPKVSISKASIDTSDDENENKAKRKRKSQGSSKTPKQRKVADTKPKTPSDIRSDLLAEWDDGSDNEIDMSQGSTTLDDDALNETQKSVDSTTDSNNGNTTNMDTTQEGDTLNDTTADENRTLDISDDISFGLDKTENDLSKDTTSVEDVINDEDKIESEKPEDKRDSIAPPDVEQSKADSDKKEKKSCFDFDEEEEESVDAFIIASSKGRKIPRVIPPTEKRLSVDLESALASSPLGVLDSDDSQLKTLPSSDENKMPSFDIQTLGESQSEVSNEQTSSIDKMHLESESHGNNDNLENAFSELLDSTAVPDLPEIPNTLKFEQNFHCTKTIKFPDKTESPKPIESKISPSKSNENLTNIATKLTNPKKRFVKSFEDFEIEQKRIASEEKRDSPKEHLDPTQGAIAVDSEAEASKSITSEETKELHFSDSSKDSSCKFISDNDTNLADKSDNNDINLDIVSAASSTKEMPESPVEQRSLRFSKLKTQVMSKLQESRPEKSKDNDLSYDVPAKLRRMSSSHRTPRSKILETYRNEHLAEQESARTSQESENGKPDTSLGTIHSELATFNSLVSAKPSENVPSTLVETDLPGASQYCLKKKKYSKLSRALSREKDDAKILPESIEKSVSEKQTIDSAEKTRLPAGPSPVPSTSLLCSIPLPEETNLLAEIAKVKIDRSSSLSEQSSGDLASVASGSDDMQNEKSTVSKVQLTEEKSETHKDDITTDNNKAIDSKLAEQQAATEMEKLFSEDSQILFSDEARSDVPVVVPLLVSKPEFSSTSELMMELADGDKSSSAEEDTSLSLGSIDFELKLEEEKDKSSDATDTKGKDEIDATSSDGKDLTSKIEKNTTTKDEHDIPGGDEKFVTSQDQTVFRSKDEEYIAGKVEQDTAGKDKQDTGGKDEQGTAGKDEQDTAGKDEQETAGKDEQDTAGKDEKDIASISADHAMSEVEEEAVSKDEERAASKDEKDAASTDENAAIYKFETTEDEKYTVNKDENDTSSRDSFHLSPLEESLLFDDLELRNKDSVIPPLEDEKLVRPELLKEPPELKENESEKPSVDPVLSDAQELISSENMLMESESEYVKTDENQDQNSILGDCSSSDSKTHSDLEQIPKVVLRSENTSIEEKPETSGHKNGSICADAMVEVDEAIKGSEVHDAVIISSSLEAEVADDLDATLKGSSETDVPKNPLTADITEKSIFSDSKVPLHEIDKQEISVPLESPCANVDENQKELSSGETSTFQEEKEVTNSAKLPTEQEPKVDENDKPADSEDVNTVHFKYTTGKDDDEFDISIKTNLSNLNSFSNNDELSALTTLATVSQLKDNLETGLISQKDEEKLLDQVAAGFDSDQKSETEVPEPVSGSSVPSQLVEGKEVENHSFPSADIASDVPMPDANIETIESESDTFHNICKQESVQVSNADESSRNGESIPCQSKTTVESGKSSLKNEPKLLPHPSFPTGHVEVPPKMQEINEADIVPIDGNLTVVSEKDLADCQVEITSSSSKNPVTLTSFSMDYSEVSSDNIYPISSKESPGTSILKAKLDCKKKKLKPIPTANITHTSSEPVIKASSILKPVKQKPRVQPIIQPHVEKGNTTTAVLAAVCDLEEHIPPQIVCAKDPSLKLTKEIPKILTSQSKETEGVKLPAIYVKETKPPVTQVHKKIDEKEVTTKPKTPKFVVKSRVNPSLAQNTQVQTISNKPIILSEKIIKPGTDAESVSVQKITSKRTYQDVEDIDTFIIQKSKRPAPSVETTKSSNQNNVVVAKSSGKAKILQQTIITASGEIIQPVITQADDNVFDINSMPIVLSDDLLTPESIEKMPIVISETLQGESVPPETTQAQPVKTTVHHQQPQQTVLNKTLAQGTVLQTALTRTVATTKVTKTAPKVIQNTTGRLIKHTSPSGGKTSKYIILPQSSTMQEVKPATVLKKQTILKKGNVVSTTAVCQNVVPEPTGNKIMIVTNQQGQKQKLLLTPNHQKLLAQGSRVTKTVVKGNVMQKSLLAPRGHQTFAMALSTSAPARPTTSGLLLTTNANTSTTVGQTATVVSQLGTPKNIKIDLKTGKKVAVQVPKTTSYIPLGKTPGQKTVVLKNQLGQTIRKFQSTDEALLEKQVAEQIQAIKASGMKTHHKTEITYKPPKTAVKRSYSKRTSLLDTHKPNASPTVNQSTSAQSSLGQTVPPLAPLASKRADHQPAHEAKSDLKSKQRDVEKKPPEQPQRPLNQLVIQDAMGNQTTITEGQILALPSETVDGQPQSYMLVTLDESGNLTPLNSEALMSLDPNLNLGGDLSNMVLQIDQGVAATSTPAAAVTTAAVSQAVESHPLKQPILHEKPVIEKKLKEKESVLVQPPQVATIKTNLPNTNLKTVEAVPLGHQASSGEVQPIPSNAVGGEPGQQLIVTGDPLATQKFLESLSEGTTDLANILANAEGGSILIQADGQQILINTDSDNQNLLLSVNTDNVNINENTESGGNPIFATQPKKNKDILAAALAGTDVFQQEQNSVQNKVVQSQLSPNSSLYPMNVGNVLEPTLTLSSPIMTPLEVPSTNSKKIADDDILGHVPKNVDLPITITDPNISQTVAQQQVASLIANELQGNLELPLPITDTTISVASTEMNSPSYVYSLPNFDDSVDMPPKSFNSSMPLLTEESDERTPSNITKDKRSSSDASRNKAAGKNSEQAQNSSEFDMKHDMENDNSSDKMSSVMHSDGSLMEEEGLCTLGGEMCTSLSEPPPDMFELDTVSTENVSNIPEKTNEAINNGVSVKGTVEEKLTKQLSAEENKLQSTGTEMNILNEDSCEIPMLPQIVTSISAEQSLSNSELGKRNINQEGKDDNT